MSAFQSLANEILAEHLKRHAHLGGSAYTTPLLERALRENQRYLGTHYFLSEHAFDQYIDLYELLKARGERDNPRPLVGDRIRIEKRDGSFYEMALLERNTFGDGDFTVVTQPMEPHLIKIPYWEGDGHTHLSLSTSGGYWHGIKLEDIDLDNYDWVDASMWVWGENARAHGGITATAPTIRWRLKAKDESFY